MGTWIFKGCPKCKGDIEYYLGEWHCLQCGKIIPVSGENSGKKNQYPVHNE